jgi:hypothetical protein
MLMKSGFVLFNKLLTLTLSTGHLKADLSALIVSYATATMECKFITHKSTHKANHCKAGQRVGTTYENFYVLLLTNHCTVKGKAVSLQAWSDPEVSRKLWFPNFMTTAQDGGKVVSLTYRPPLPPGNTPGTHFC